MKEWKKLVTAAPLLSAITVSVCVFASLGDYTPPVYEVKAEKLSVEPASADAESGQESEETNVQEDSAAVGNFDKEDGKYQGEATGYAGQVKVEVTIKDKSITEIEVLEESDDAAFFNRAKAVIDKIINQQELDVDVVSGATYSSNGIINAVKNALTGEVSTSTTAAASSSANPVTTPAAISEPSSYKDGTYYGTAAGFSGTIKVKVVISGGKIASVEVVSHSDGDSYMQSAKSVISAILSAQSTNVDTVSGATYSSTGIINAVRNALQQAGGTESTSSTNNSSSKSSSKKSSSESTSSTKKTNKVDVPDDTNVTYKDGTYYGTGEGYGGAMKVKVTVKNGKITAIKIASHQDGEEFIEKASGVIDSIISKQSLDVDTVSGATYSSWGIIDAVNQALESARVTATPTPTPTATPTKTPTPTPTQGTLKYVNGEYTGMAICYPDEWEDFWEYTLHVTLVIENDLIMEVKDAYGDGDGYEAADAWYISRALNGGRDAAGIADQIYSSNSLEGIDTVSQATCSSKALIKACKNALAQAENTQTGDAQTEEPSEGEQDE